MTSTQGLGPVVDSVSELMLISCSEEVSVKLGADSEPEELLRATQRAAVLQLRRKAHAKLLEVTVERCSVAPFSGLWI